MATLVRRGKDKLYLYPWPNSVAVLKPVSGIPIQASFMPYVYCFAAGSMLVGLLLAGMGILQLPEGFLLPFVKQQSGGALK